MFNMIGSIGSALLGGIFGSSSQSSANATNIRLARESQDYDWKKYQDQKKFQEYMWNLQNEYDLPVNQVQRLIDAGINPALALGNVSTGSGSSIPSAPSGGSTPSATVQPIDYGSIGAGISNALLQYYQARKASADARLTEEQADSQEVANKYQVLTILLDLAKARSEVKKNKSESRYVGEQFNQLFMNREWNNENVRADFALKSAQANFVSESVTQMVLQNKILRRQHELGIADWQVNLLAATVAEKAANTRLSLSKVITESLNQSSLRLSNTQKAQLFPLIEDIYRNNLSGNEEDIRWKKWRNEYPLLNVLGGSATQLALPFLK